MSFRSIRSLLIFLTLLALPLVPLAAQSAEAPLDPEGWPREIEGESLRAVLYQPQLDSWDRYRLTAHSALAIYEGESEEPI